MYILVRHNSDHTSTVVWDIRLVLVTQHLQIYLDSDIPFFTPLKIACVRRTGELMRFVPSSDGKNVADWWDLPPELMNDFHQRNAPAALSMQCGEHCR